MSPPDIIALRQYLGAGPKDRTISDARHSVSLTDMIEHSCLTGGSFELSGRSVLLATSRQLLSALAMIELDGVARRILLGPPDLDWDRLQVLLDQAGIDTIVTDQPLHRCSAGKRAIIGVDLPERKAVGRKVDHATEWLMLTSGTSGLPKIVRHTLDGLAGAIIADGPARYRNATWATFYDIRRYGGLQIFLRAVIGGGSMVLSEPGEAIAAHVARLRAGGVTHISGTPSHWRKLLMSGASADFSPHYVRLSGEIADQAVLDGLARAFPHASIGHAYASTEAGVGFSVDDGREGFPAHLIGQNRAGVEMKVVDGSLRIRSRRTARAYVGADAPPLADTEGFVDTGDMVELRGERYHFVGRRGGIINIGGLKVHPEEVEAVINRHASVQMSRARSRRSPITGAIVVADVILTNGTDGERHETIRAEILSQCKNCLAVWKVPAVIRFVERLDVTAAGKLARTDA
ncbi:AMP-binding protein [Bradyrhizobium diazoefficiens]|uniref:Long-chain-fatty-acid--CoA ligase n=2 Tax=Bradyrhizobium diazoefficiens TaxID=1355477 RepID=Q89GQ8_BRADU|nr:class I adenylate-forming enzyme family protein [Bradyrhizobium diazoefficiens]AND91389.1 2-succinylbenzoate--CoA ligase [Bradyrhizobium diazoefficiens USDA 110]QBP25042.1 long-chain fatty acid--CoA ligase [Bradyrhizobium diazoefficiens]QLD41994.1 acyl--CoA ligase [Bradyrhizobium diazoefficiens]WLB36454.1 class I adenylate-forming enzyme family protein [Bradyrhizobium diazoefficiens]WLC18546.1 class I adenylate-forming enzyme family protein [Bradyrhizobium diazoefficiens]